MDENGYFDCDFEAFGEGWYRYYDAYLDDFVEVEQVDYTSKICPLKYETTVKPISLIEICSTDTKE